MASASTKGPSWSASSRSRPRSWPAPTSSTPRSCAGRPSRSPEEIGWEIEPSRAQFLPDSVAYWLPFREANAAMDRLGSGTTSGSSPTSTTSCSGSPAATCAPSSTSSSPPSRSAATSPTRPTSRSAPAGSAARRAGSTSAPATTTDVAPLLKMNVPVIWVNRHGEKLDGRKAPDATVKNFRDAAKKLGAK